MKETRKKRFTEQDKEQILDLFKKEKNITRLAEAFGSTKGKKLEHKELENLRRKIGQFLDREGISNNKFRLEDSSEYKEASARKLTKKKYYIITWEQNETPLHKGFWKNILTYKEFLDAELSVILGRYRNPTSVFKDLKHENWNKDTKPYWDASRHDIHKYLTVLSDVKISPTRKYPLTGLQGLSQGKTIVVGHPKLHLKTEPTLNNYAKKMLLTTGAVTVPNYTDSGAGAISKGVHKLGFVIVEVHNNEIFYIRQVEADKDGNFIDLCYEVNDDGVTKIDKALGLVCGDSHHWHLDPKIDKANDKICEAFNIKNLVLHDAVDGESVNHWKLKSPIQQYKRITKNEYLAEKELEDLGNWIGTKLKYNPIIPQANHNARFDRVLENDWRKDIHNASFYMKYTPPVLDGRAERGVMAYYLEEKFGEQVKCLDFQDSYKIAKYEISLHGDYGNNGSKGSPVGFRNLEIPMILAHSHVPFRADDCLYVGTNTHLILDYNKKGASSWLQSNVLISKNGLAQHIIFVNGKYTTFDI